MAFNRMCKVWMVFKMARELIRKATLEDMPVLLEIYERARKFMVSTGNTNQWTNGYPSREILTEDIEKNDFNLNIPRYVDNFEKEEDVDINTLLQDMKKTDDELERVKSDFVSLLKELTSPDPDIISSLNDLIGKMEG